MKIPQLDPLVLVVLVGGLAYASWSDMRTGRIPNTLTFPMMLLGVLVHLRTIDPWFGLLGLGVATLVHYPLWMLQVEKAGDAKLLMGVGALLGWRELVEASAWYAILYLPFGFLYLAAKGRLGNLLVVMKHLNDKANKRDVGPPPETTPLRTAPIIASATAIAALTGLIYP